MIIDILIVITVIALCSKAYKWIEYPSATAIVLVFYSIYVYGGAIYTYYYYHAHEWALSDQFDTTIYIIRIGLLSLVSACFVANKIIPRTRIFPESNNVPSNSPENIAVNIFAVFSFIIGILYLYVVPSIPVKYLFFDSVLLAAAREEATTTFKYFNYFSNFIYGYLPIVTMYFYFNGNKARFAIFFLLSMFLSITSGQKAPVVYLLLLLMLSISLKNKKMYYFRFALIFVFTSILLLLFVFYENRFLYDQVNTGAIQAVSIGLMQRIFGGAQTLIAYVEYFPTFDSFSFLRSSNIPIDQIIYKYLYPDSLIIGSANAVFLGNLYANFGNIFILGIISFIAFLLVFSIDNYWFNNMTSCLHFALYVFFSITCMKFAITDYNTAFTNISYPGLSLYGFVLLFGSMKYKGVIGVRPFNKGIAYLSIIIFLYVLQGQVKGLLLSK